MSQLPGNRFRCCVTGCNPVLIGEEAANQHRDEQGHRIAKWPTRSAEGKRKAEIRNKTGYYDKYNAGSKSREQHSGESHEYDDHPFSPEALGQD